MLRTLKTFLKYLISYTLYYSGVLGLLRSFKLKNCVVVLMYHRVLSDHEKISSFSNDGIIVSPETFDNNIAALKNRFKILSISSLLEKINNNTPFDTASCLITFDDGWADNYKNAFPVIKKYSVPALIFLPTDYVGKNDVFWQEKLSYYLYIALTANDNNHFIEKHGLADLRSDDHHMLRNNILTHVNKLKSLPYSKINTLLDEFRAHIKAQGEKDTRNMLDAYLSWAQVNEMKSAGVEFGSHAISHRILTRITDDELEQELNSSKKVIESKLESEIDSIAYPNGDYNGDVLNATSGAGYKIGFTTERGYFKTGENPLKIKRINMQENVANSTPMLMCRILGIF